MINIPNVNSNQQSTNIPNQYQPTSFQNTNPTNQATNQPTKPTNQPTNPMHHPRYANFCSLKPGSLRLSDLKRWVWGGGRKARGALMVGFWCLKSCEPLEVGSWNPMTHRVLFFTSKRWLLALGFLKHQQYLVIIIAPRSKCEVRRWILLVSKIMNRICIYMIQPPLVPPHPPPQRGDTSHICSHV